MVVEEFLEGEEASFFAFIDGENCTPLVGAQVGGTRSRARAHARAGRGNGAPEAFLHAQAPVQAALLG